jgi:hypothetical protein
VVEGRAEKGGVKERGDSEERVAHHYFMVH